MTSGNATGSTSGFRHLETRLTVNLDRASRTANVALILALGASFVLGLYVSFYFHFLTVVLLLTNAVNFYWRHLQVRHTLLANYGFLAQVRYLLESVGPEFRQYLFANDSEERPFSRNERAEVYRKAKGIDSSGAFGTQRDLATGFATLRHSFFPAEASQASSFQVSFGDQRDCPHPYTAGHPVFISAMSYGSLGWKAVRALARGARKAGIPMNTGEGGHPKHHLAEGADLIFQMGTAKFGVRTEDGQLDDERLEALSAHDQVKMVEIKLSQGAKPGKGGLLPKEKISEEIAELRGVPRDRDVVSPAFHPECVDPASTVAFIRRVQEVSGLPVGIKFCLGRDSELRELVQEMRSQDVFPDWITVDGAEGGTGAAPRSFMDGVGLPLFQALPTVQKILTEEGATDRTRILASGKLIDARRQLVAMAMGASATYTARGFMLALGCIQALQCNQNTCPVGITTHDPALQRGLDIEEKSERVARYARALCREQGELLAAMGVRSRPELDLSTVHLPTLNGAGS